MESVSHGGLLASTIGTLNPFRYRGYVYDGETGLYYLQSRYYDPEVCRFLSSDVLLSTGQGVIGCNAFAYCGNEPITRMDNDGHSARMDNDGHSAHVVELIGGGSSQNGSETSAGEIRDVTNEIDVALADVVYQAKMDKDIYKSDWIQYPVQRLNIYSKFRNMVNHDAPWDIKREQRWKDTIQTDFPGFDTKVKYREHEVTPENIGNITYGYIGAAYDIPLPVLICGSYYAAGLPIESAALKNETGDWNYISMGYDYYFADLLK